MLLYEQQVVLVERIRLMNNLDSRKDKSIAWCDVEGYLTRVVVKGSQREDTATNGELCID